MISSQNPIYRLIKDGRFFCTSLRMWHNNFNGTKLYDLQSFCYGMFLNCVTTNSITASLLLCLFNFQHVWMYFCQWCFVDMFPLFSCCISDYISQILFLIKRAPTLLKHLRAQFKMLYRKLMQCHNEAVALVLCSAPTCLPAREI